jgi:hypothetical protein
MDERSFDEELAYRIAARRFESAFEACEKLSQEDKQLLSANVASEGWLCTLYNPSADSVQKAGMELEETIGLVIFGAMGGFVVYFVYAATSYW